jgi:hypothetical protein
VGAIANLGDGVVSVAFTAWIYLLLAIIFNWFGRLFGTTGLLAALRTSVK